MELHEEAGKKNNNITEKAKNENSTPTNNQWFYVFFLFFSWHLFFLFTFRSFFFLLGKHRPPHKSHIYTHRNPIIFPQLLLLQSFFSVLCSLFSGLDVLRSFSFTCELYFSVLFSRHMKIIWKPTSYECDVTLRDKNKSSGGGWRTIAVIWWNKSHLRLDSETACPLITRASMISHPYKART